MASFGDAPRLDVRIRDLPLAPAPYTAKQKLGKQKAEITQSNAET